MIQKPQIAAVGGDPGPAQALAPVLRKLRDDGLVGVFAFHYGHAKRIWQELSLGQKPLSSKLDVLGALKLLKEINASALLVCTSYNDLMLEHPFIDAAHKLDVPSLALLDFPSHFRARFIGRDGQQLHLPDAIAVDSPETRSRMLKEGFSEDMIKITGAPAFDTLASFSKSFSQERRQEIRRALGVDQNDVMVLFASQPLARIFDLRPGLLGELGYDEFLVLKLIIQALENIARELDGKVRLVVRPHPREDPAKFSSLSAKDIFLTVHSDFSSWDVIMAADLVVGMSSVLLMEACHLGSIVVSVQPGLRQTDTLPTNLSGHSHAVYDKDQLKPVLQRLLFDDNARRSALERLDGLKSDGLAAARVAELIVKMAKGER